MPNGSSLPLFGPSIDLESKNSKALAALGGLLLVARAAPGAAARGLGTLLGVETAGAAAPAAINPLFITNLLPQPIGFVPPENYGLKPNFYLPGSLGAGLPNWFPGAAEQTAERDRKTQIYLDAKRRAEAERYNNLFPTLPSGALLGYIRDAANPATNAVYADPVGVIAIAQRVIDQRTAARLKEEAIAAAAATPTSGGTAVPINPTQLFPGGGLVNGQGITLPGSVAAGIAAAGVSTGTYATVPPGQQEAPGPGPEGVIGAPGNATNDDLLQNFKRKYPGLIGGPLIDGFIATAVADPWTGIA